MNEASAVTRRAAILNYIHYRRSGGEVVVLMLDYPGNDHVTVHTLKTLILFSFKVHEINQESCSYQEGLGAHFQIHWEGYAKVVCISESLSTEPSPLLRYQANLGRVITSEYLKVYVIAAAYGTCRTLDLEDNIIRGVPNSKLARKWGTHTPLLMNAAQNSSWRAGYLYALKAAGATAAVAGEGARQVQHLLFLVIHEGHLETPQRTATLASKAVRVFLGEQELLTQTVLQHVFIVHLTS